MNSFEDSLDYRGAVSLDPPNASALTFLQAKITIKSQQMKFLFALARRRVFFLLN